jgi:hypothetical protein
MRTGRFAHGHRAIRDHEQALVAPDSPRFARVAETTKIWKSARYASYLARLRVLVRPPESVFSDKLQTRQSHFILLEFRLAMMTSNVPR